MKGKDINLNTEQKKQIALTSIGVLLMLFAHPFLMMAYQTSNELYAIGFISSLVIGFGFIAYREERLSIYISSLETNKEAKR